MSPWVEWWLRRLKLRQMSTFSRFDHLFPLRIHPSLDFVSTESLVAGKKSSYSERTDCSSQDLTGDSKSDPCDTKKSGFSCAVDLFERCYWAAWDSEESEVMREVDMGWEASESQWTVLRMPHATISPHLLPSSSFSPHVLDSLCAPFTLFTRLPVDAPDFERFELRSLLLNDSWAELACDR